MAPRTSRSSKGMMPAAPAASAVYASSAATALNATGEKFSASPASDSCVPKAEAPVSHSPVEVVASCHADLASSSAAHYHSPAPAPVRSAAAASDAVGSSAPAAPASAAAGVNATTAGAGVAAVGAVVSFDAWLAELLRPPQWRLLLDADPTVVRPFLPEVRCCICVLQRRLEAAGRAFLEKYEISRAAPNVGSKNQREKPRRGQTSKGEHTSDKEEEFYAVDEDRWRSKRRGAGSRGAAGNAAGRCGGGGSGSTFLSVTHLKKLLAAEQTLYAVLGVQEGASTEEIKKRYRRLVLEHHPDKAKRRQDGSSDSLSLLDGAGAGAVSATTTRAAAASAVGLTGPSDVVEGASGAAAGNTAAQKGSTGGVAAAAEKREIEKPEAGKPSGSTGGGTCSSSGSNSAEPEDGHAHFLKIQEAYEALTDVEFRRQYDSALPFDDAVPAAAAVKSQESFFTVFRPVFESNARWSARRPVPALGDANTPTALVNAFYDFWFDFQSWRDFGVHDEYDLNEAESREERRWMDRENQRVRKKHMKTERARIQKLVETAYSLDPRVLKEKEAAKKKREEEKAARQRVLEEQRKQKELEDRKLRESAAAEQRRKEEEEKQRVLRERQQRDNHKKWRQRVRQLNAHFSRTTAPSSSSPSPSPSAASDSSGFLDAVELQELCQKLSVEQLQDVCRAIFAAADLTIPVADEHGAPAVLPEFSTSQELRDNVAGILRRFFQQTREAEKAQEKEAALEAARRRLERKEQEEARRLARQGSWTPDELSLLAKGLQKFPGGTVRRWKLIADLVGTKTQEERAPEFMSVAEGSGTLSKNSTRSPRSTHISRTVENLLAARQVVVVEKTKEMSEGMSLKSMGAKISQVAFNQFKIHNQGAFKKIETNPDKKDVGDVPVVVSANEKSSKPDDKVSGEWTAVQQLALEKALAEFPSTMPASERWASIGDRVPGKTKKECIERFKQIRAAILQAKKGESS